MLDCHLEPALILFLFFVFEKMAIGGESLYCRLSFVEVLLTVPLNQPNCTALCIHSESNHTLFRHHPTGERAGSIWLGTVLPQGD